MQNTQQRRLDLSKYPFQFSILRYVPEVERNEPRNIGVVVRALDGTAVRIRLANMSARLWVTLGPTAKTLAESLEKSVDLSSKDNVAFGRLGSPRDIDFLERARREFTGHLQFTETRGLLAESVDAAAADVFERYVAQARVRHPAAHATIAPYYKLDAAISQRQ